ncbi:MULTISPECIES: CBS domain-containing protein [unclassified Pseudonocardia]|jgi:CBS domain-containing protein|uniref:CBS domain-containing protein n=1 Tax=unclassified Pseudonocardia TaxID=2619320 RepID=UPI00096857B8|nr:MULTISPECIES: CBS domain-containing protein [unclassified Pseudonocardia]MBN9096983.1 CBS domain-containing protein [Pseudonocardia sp.]OJY46276.1 MAG: histidine kinase [Pseudonocardia sp. 73-21]
MKVADILQRKGDTVHTIFSWNTVAEAVTRLAGPPAIGALVVCDNAHGHVDGIVTERDIIRALKDSHGPVGEMAVADVMSRYVPVCSPEDTLAHLMAQMTRSRQRHLPVVRDGALCGLVSIGDVVRHRVEEMQLEADVLRDMYLAHR